MSYEDERIVKMTFDNESFKKGVKDTISALDKLEKSLDIDTETPGKSFKNLDASLSATEKALNGVDDAVLKVKASFSAMQIVGMTVLSDLTRSAMKMGNQLWNSTIGQIKSGGNARALNIENAKFQLAGLGVAWDAISDDIDYAVKGTAYGLDAAAKVASQLVASGTEIGDQMKNALRGISGVAAMTNSTYEDIGNIFTTVAANGKLMTMQLRQLSARGLNASAQLSKVLKVSEAEINQMVTKGQIDFETFANAMDEAFGEHAKEANKTFTGALSNMKAALSRIGEKFITPFHDMERDIYNSVRPVLDTFKDALGDKNGGIVQIWGWILDRINKVSTSLLSNEKFLKSAKNIVTAIYKIVENVLHAIYILGVDLSDTGLLGLAEKIADALDKITSKFILTDDGAKKLTNFVIVLGDVFSIFTTVLDSVLYVLEPVIDAFKDLFTGTDKEQQEFAENTVVITNSIKEIIKQLAVISRFGTEKLLPVIGKGLEIIFKIIVLMPAVLNKIIQILPALITAIKVAWTISSVAIAGIVTLIVSIPKAVMFMKDKVVSAFNFIAKKVQSVFESIRTMVKLLTTSIDDAGNVGINIANGVLEGLYSRFDAVKEAIGKLADIAIIKEFADKLMIHSPSIIMNHLGGFVALGAAEGIEEKSPAVEQAGRRMIDMMYVGIKKEADSKSGEVEDAYTSIGNSIKNSIDSMVDAISPAVEKLTAFFSNTFAFIVIGATATAVAATIAAGVIVTKLIGSILSSLNAIPELIGAISDLASGFKWYALTGMLQSMAVFFLAFGAVLATIGVIAKFVDPEALKKVTLYASLLMVATSIFANVVAVFSLVSAIRELVLRLPKIVKNDLLVKFSTSITSLKNLFSMLAVFLGVVLGSLLVIRHVAQMDGGYGELMKALAFVSGILAVIGLFVIAIQRTLTANSFSKSIKTVNALTKSVSLETVNMFGGLIGFMLALLPLFAAITAAVILLSRENMTNVAESFGLLMSVFALMMAFIMSIMIYVNKTVMRYKTSVANINNMSAFRDIAGAISGTVLAISGFILAFTAAVYILTTISDVDALWRAFGIIAIMVGIVGLIIGGIMATFTVMQKKARSAKEVLMHGTDLGKLVLAISAFIGSLSGFVIAISFALGILTLTDQIKLWTAAQVLWATIGVVTAAIGLIMLSVKTFSRKIKDINGSDSSLFIGNSTGAARSLSKILNAIGFFVSAFAGSIAVIAIFPVDRIVASTVALCASMIIISGMVKMLLMSVSDFTGVLREASGGNQFGGAFNKVLNAGAAKTLIMTLLGVAAFISTYAAALYLVSKIDYKTLEHTTIWFGGALATLFIAITAMIVLISGALNKTSFMTAADMKMKLLSIGRMILMLAGSILIVMGSLGLIIFALDSIKNPKSILYGMGIFAEVLLGLGGLIYVISKMPTLNPAVLAGVLQTAIGLGSVMLAFSGMIYIMSLVDWSVFNWDVIGYLAAMSLMVELIVVTFAKFGPALTASMGGIIAISALLTVIAGIVAGVGFVIRRFSDGLDKLKDTINMLDEFKTEEALRKVDAIRQIIKDLVGALKDSLILSVTAYILGTGMKHLMEAFEIMKYIDPKTAEAFYGIIKQLLNNINELWPLVLSCAGVIAALGLFGGGLAVAAVGLLAFGAALPYIVKLFAKGIHTLNELMPQITADIQSIVESCASMWKAIEDQGLNVLFKNFSAAMMMLWAASVFIALAGLNLAVGAAGLYVGAYVMTQAAPLVKKMLSTWEAMFGNKKQLKKMSETAKAIEVFMLVLFGIGVTAVVASGPLIGGMALICGGLGIMLGAGVLLDTAMESWEDALKNSEKTLFRMLVLLGALFVMSEIIFVVSVGMIVSFAFLCAGAGAMVGAGAILEQAFDVWKDLTFDLEVAWSVVWRLAVITLALAAFVVPFALVGAFLVTASAEFAVGAWALVGAFEGFKYLGEKFNLETMGKAILALLGIVGTLDIIAFMMAGSMPVLVSGALSFSAAIIALSPGALILGFVGLALGAGAYLLGEAFKKLSEIDYDVTKKVADVIAKFIADLIDSIEQFVDIDFEDAILPIIGFAIAVALAGTLLFIGAGGLLIGSLALWASVNILGAAFEDLITVMNETSETKVWAAFGKLLTLVFGLLVPAIALSVVGSIFFVGAVTFWGGAKLLNSGLNLLADSAKKGIFKTVSGSMLDIVSIAGAFAVSSKLIAWGGAEFADHADEILEGAIIFDQACKYIAHGASLLVDVYAEYKEVGKMTVLGFSDGLKANKDDIVNAVHTMDKDWILGTSKKDLGINSPAEELWEIAKQCVAGIVTGLEDNKDGIKGAMNVISDQLLESGGQALDVFGNMFTNGMADLGINASGMFGNSFLSGISTTMSQASNLSSKAAETISNHWISAASTIGQQMQSILSGYNYSNVNSRVLGGTEWWKALTDQYTKDYRNNGMLSEEQAKKIAAYDNRQAAQERLDFITKYDLTNTKTKQLDKNYPGQQKYIEQSVEEATKIQQEYIALKAVIEAADAVISDWNKTKETTTFDAGNFDYDSLPTGTGEGFSDIGSGSGSASGVKASNVGSNVGTSITNNTYNFVQNNYSPEPIDRNELYLQTNNQLNSFYKWLGAT